MITFNHPDYGQIVVGKPQATEDGQNYSCEVNANGRGMPIFGVTPLDALENAVKIARAFAPIKDGDPAGWQVS